MNPQKNRKRQNNKGRGVRGSKIVALLVLFCLCIGGISMVSAKYIKQNNTKNNSATAKEFYFESDLLDGKEHEVVATKAADGTATASVTIRLKNYADELRYSETEIQYEVSVTEKNSDEGTDTDPNEQSEDSNIVITGDTGTIDAGAKNHADVTLSNLEAGKTYVVTAATSNIYQKTLTGTINVVAPDDTLYAYVRDNTQYIEVTVWTTDYAGEVTLKYDNKTLLPDNTDTKMRDVSTTNATFYQGSWEANTSHVFRFFKTNEKNTYQVTVNGTEVTVSEK